MQKLDLCNIPLQDRRKLFIVDEDIDRLVLEISTLSKQKKEMADCQLLTTNEFKMFSGDTYHSGDILLWNAAEEKYFKIEDVGKEDLIAFRRFLIEKLMAKKITINYNDEETNKKKKGVETGPVSTGRPPKTQQELSIGGKFHWQTTEEIVSKLSSEFTFSGNEGKKISDKSLISQENLLRECGLLNSNSPYGDALAICKGEGKGHIKYEVYKRTKNDLSWSVNMGAKLGDYLGIKAFAKYHGVSETELSSSCVIDVNFLDEK